MFPNAKKLISECEFTRVAHLWPLAVGISFSFSPKLLKLCLLYI